MNLESLKAQLANTENELEQARAHAYRCDGAIQMLKHLINELESGKDSPDETFADSKVDNAPVE